jgi:hypothetical protein
VVIPHPYGINPHLHGMHALDHFGPGETPAVTLYGCSGEVVSWTLTNLATGQLVQKNNQYVPVGNHWTVPFPGLAPGSYHVSFALHGSEIASARFLKSG